MIILYFLPSNLYKMKLNNILEKIFFSIIFLFESRQ